jgi:segregation and condensation protein A
VSWEEFEGPLDLLLEEARRQNVALENIALAPIVARYLEYMRSAIRRNANLDIEWLDMAATLIYWKSRSLLPQDASRQPRADPIRDDLVRQLLTHRRDAAGDLARRFALEETRFSKADAAAPDPTPEQHSEAGFVSVWDLIQRARELANWVGQNRVEQRQWRESFRVEQDDVTVEEMITYLQTQLAHGSLDGSSLINSQPSVSHRSCLFLGMLEMARNDQLRIEQTESFGPILVYPNFGAQL